MDSPSPRSVLVVDDDASIRFLCRVNLELEGWNVLEAGTGAEARDQLARDDVVAVLLDVHVGSESGVDLLKEIRRSHPGVPVAILTGSIGTPAFEGVAPDAVIPKPFTLDVLTSTVRDLAAGGR